MVIVGALLLLLVWCCCCCCASVHLFINLLYRICGNISVIPRKWRRICATFVGWTFSRLPTTTIFGSCSSICSRNAAGDTTARLTGARSSSTAGVTPLEELEEEEVVEEAIMSSTAMEQEEVLQSTD